ncbi:hypothetical protein [Flavonifractor sp. An82]|uniref:hypothetical protein n=1 Tax=Flavonifractor sp. An82 TaxID=1965660 RepID=UPI0013A66F7B|nr:hypothetical protein [Flavonifractor sp. An82]
MQPHHKGRTFLPGFLDSWRASSASFSYSLLITFQQFDRFHNFSVKLSWQMGGQMALPGMIGFARLFARLQSSRWGTATT